jgi:NTP pyrophosphatase (non-canonical NTP hydrolase)
MPMAHNGLAKLVEESGELSQVAGKLLQYPHGEHPDGQGPLLHRLELEMGDVLAALRFVAQKHQIDSSRVNFYAASKLELFNKWDKE